MAALEKRIRRTHSGVVHLIGALDDEMLDSTVARECFLHLYEAHRSTPKAKAITLYISCDGGGAANGILLCSAIDHIRRAGRDINGHVMGSASSYGLIILQHCSKRIAEYSATLMAHEFQFDGGPNTSNALSIAEHLRKLELKEHKLWSSRTGKPPSYYSRKTKGMDWFLTADEALAEGLLDEVIDVPTLPRAEVGG